MTGIQPRDPLPAIKGATAHVAEADTDQALVDELHQLLPCDQSQDDANGARSG